MENTNAIDLIIPLYNAEKWIPGLIATLEGQTFRNFRAVFVDDGSQDSTYGLLEQQLKSVSFPYLLVHQENKGLPGARNTGIRHAQAEWIAFLDSDDELDANYLAFLYRGVTENKTNVGICCYQMITKAEEALVVKSCDFKAETVDSAACMRTYYTKWFGAWVLILRRGWLEQQGLLFDEACTYLEDVPFITQVIAAADSVTMIHNPVYLYYKREGSLMRTPRIEKYVTALAGFHRMAEKMRDMDSAPAEEFRTMGAARYYLATLRRGAILMPYGLFRELCSHVPMAGVRHQLGRLQGEQRLAGRLYLISKRLFYHAMRIMTRDH